VTRRKKATKSDRVPAAQWPQGIETALSEVPGINVSWDGDKCRVAWERVNVALTLRPSQVIRHQRVVDPFGQPAEMLLLNVSGTPVQVAISGSDLVFEPDESVRVSDLDGPSIQVVDMPQMVGYSEVLRDLDVLEGMLGTEPNIDRLFGFAVRLRFFIAGAERIGVDCVELMARWERLWKRLLAI
jgi:hypothetical protein